MNIVISNCTGILDNGQEVIPFPSRWCSGIPRGQRAPFKFFPYELATLSALLKREVEEERMPHATVTMIDPNVHRWDAARTIAELAKLKPDVLICELSALTYPTMTRVMQAVMPGMPAMGGSYMLEPGKRAILCGPMGAHDPDRAQREGWTDIVKGEYELDVLQLLGGTVPPGARTETGLLNLDWLPWPEDEDVRRNGYEEINHYSAPATIQIYNATRGCPLSCTFCVVPTYYGGHGKSHKSHRTRNVEDVCDEIEYLVALGEHQGWQFSGAYFNEEAHNANTEWFVALCETLIRRGLNKYSYDAMCGMWPFDRELVQLAKAAGYRQIRFGMESTSEAVGKAIKKTIFKARTEQFLTWLKEAEIGAYATIMVGAMGSTEVSDRQTIADVKDWIGRGMLQKWQLSTSTPQPSTPFWDLCQKEGWLVTENPADLDGYRACVNFPDYPAARIQAVRNEAGL